MAAVGDLVIFTRLPAWVVDLPPESQQVFRFCLGRTYRVTGIDKNGLLVLNVSADIDHRFGGFMNDIRVEEEFVDVVSDKSTRP